MGLKVNIDEKQKILTRLIIIPKLKQFQSYLYFIRHQIDHILTYNQTEEFRRNYPIGKCLEIALEAHCLFFSESINSEDTDVIIGWQALKLFLEAGGVCARHWGDLRGEYFQNAFQIGSLYVDVANDTVVTTKPKIEILSLESTNFTLITDYEHYIKIAAKYWNDAIFPNHMIPEISPYCPLIHITREGVVQLHEINSYMQQLTIDSQFMVSERILSKKQFTDRIFKEIKPLFCEIKGMLAVNPIKGRVDAIKFCRRYRRAKYYDNERINVEMIKNAISINRHLSTISKQHRLQIYQITYR